MATYNMPSSAFFTLYLHVFLLFGLFTPVLTDSQVNYIFPDDAVIHLLLLFYFLFINQTPQTTAISISVRPYTMLPVSVNALTRTDMQEYIPFSALYCISLLIKAEVQFILSVGNVGLYLITSDDGLSLCFFIV